jgi:hypothetical protein
LSGSGERGTGESKGQREDPGEAEAKLHGRELLGLGLGVEPKRRREHPRDGSLMLDPNRRCRTSTGMRTGRARGTAWRSRGPHASPAPSPRCSLHPDHGRQAIPPRDLDRPARVSTRSPGSAQPPPSPPAGPQRKSGLPPRVTNCRPPPAPRGQQLRHLWLRSGSPACLRLRFRFAPA